MDKITNKNMDDAVNQLLDENLKPLRSECSDLLCCKRCGNIPRVTQVFCSGMYYECDCGVSACRFPLPQGDNLARKIWNDMNYT